VNGGFLPDTNIPSELMAAPGTKGYRLGRCPRYQRVVSERRERSANGKWDLQPCRTPRGDRVLNWRSNAIWHFYFGTKDFEQLGVSILNPWSE
jgi:hypothetical protein